MSDAIQSTTGFDRGIGTPGARPDYKSFRSDYGPKYTVAKNVQGITMTGLKRFGITAGLFAGSLGFGLLFFAADVPRVRIDIMQRVPIIGEYWRKEVPPEDDPF